MLSMLCRWLPLLLLAGSVLAAETVQLRLENGSHSAPIRAVAADAAGRFAVSASEDKTARVWDLSQGTLLQTFRPPSAAGNNGKLYAAAMTPDGSTYAVAGWSVDNDIYLVNRNDGRILRRISGLPDIVTRLAFAPDGHLLAAGLGGANGIRLFAAGDGWRKLRELGGGGDYAAEITGLAWAPQGAQLFASAADGSLRSYQVQNKGLRAVQRELPTDIGTPHGLAVSPDGSKLALGSATLASVAVLDAATLKPLALLAPPPGRSGRALSTVAWSADNASVSAAGTWVDEQGRFAICSWRIQSPAKPNCKGLASDSITGLHGLADGRLLHVAATPALGMLDAAGQSQFQIAGNALDFRQGRSRFRLADDASALSLPLGPAGGEAGFDIRQAGWVTPRKQWSAPQSYAGGTGVENWFERNSPQIGGKRLQLDNNELALAAAVAPDGERVAIASNQQIRLYDRHAQQLWQAPVPATPWQVNLSRDGRWLVAAFSDGSIRWYASQSGQEQLALLPHGDRRRWILWTPAGYFATSPGGESLLGWQVDRGAERAADFYPAARFRDQFYRPELIGSLFDQAPVTAPAAAKARPPAPAIAARLPPTLRILAPDNLSRHDGGSVRLRLLLSSPVDAPATELRARINGQLASLPPLAKLPAGPTDTAGELTVELPLSLPPGDVRVLLFAANRHGNSPEAELNLQGAPAPPAPAALPPAAGGVDYRPTLYVLAIGVSQYRDPSIQLEYAAKDSTDLAAFFKHQEGGLYRKVAVRLLTNAGATRDGVLDGLEWIRRELTARDVAVIFIAGHGVNDPDGTYYFLPQDVELKRMKRSGVIFTEIRNTLVSLPGKALFFIDTCHSGNVLGTGSRGIRNDPTAVINELSSSENGVIVFAAATGRQYAMESPDWGNGAFTKAILEGLGGKADVGQSGRITHKMLDLYLSERVKQLTEGAQSPVTIVPNGVPDFPLVLSRSGGAAR